MSATIDIDDDKRLRHKYDEGMEMGMEKGIERGRNEGEAHLLRILLRQKFGPLSSFVEQQLQSATQQQLDRWGARILFVATIDEVLQ